MWVLNMKAAVSGGNPTWDRVRVFFLVMLAVGGGGGRCVKLRSRRVDDKFRAIREC